MAECDRQHRTLRWREPTLVVTLLVSLIGCAHRRSSPPLDTGGPVVDTLRKVPDDYANYYSRSNLRLLAWGLGAGAVMAHTDFDEDVRSWYQEDVRTEDGDDFSESMKLLGEGQYVFPILGCSLALGAVLEQETCHESVLGDWAGRSLRAVAVGTPPMLFLQMATGAARPGESSAESDWQPFNDNNGVSGHCFVGAVPFITAAKMTDDPWMKGGFYFASTLAGWSRVNDDAHYVSQAVVGWWMAYLAASVVDDTEWERCHLYFTPLPMPGGEGFGVVLEY